MGILDFFKRRKVVSESYNTMTKLLTIEYDNGDIKEYIGDCTIWRDAKTFKRVGTMREAELCDIQYKILYKK